MKTAQERFEELFQLLPAVYRNRDVLEGEPLRAFFEGLLAQHAELEEAVRGAWAGWFIETCAPWQIPYLAELIGFRPQAFARGVSAEDRAVVGRWLSNQRRKGTARGLEGAFCAQTGKAAVVVDGRSSAAVTATARLPQLGLGRLPDLRKVGARAIVGGPFEQFSRIPRVAPRRGRTAWSGGGRSLPRPDAATLFCWRLLSHGVSGSSPHALGAGRYTFDPAALDVPLFNPQSPRRLPPEGARASDLPGPLSRWTLAMELAARQEGAAPRTRFFAAPAAFSIRSKLGEISVRELAIANLDDWKRPRPLLTDGARARVWVDPERGRFLMRSNGAQPVAVDYASGLAGDVGAGPYPSPPGEGAVRAQLAIPPAAAGRALRALHAGELRERRIELTSSASADFGELELDLAGRQVWLSAARGMRPYLRLRLRLFDSVGGGSLSLRGLMLDGSLGARGELSLDLEACTLVPRAGRASIEVSALSAASAYPSLRLARCIAGPVEVRGGFLDLEFERSILDATGGEHALRTGPGALHVSRARIAACTLLGAARLAVLQSAKDSLFDGPLHVERTATGSITHCWLAPGSQTPPRSDCAPGPRKPLERAALDSRTYGSPDYARPALHAQEELLFGSSKGASIGAFPKVLPLADANDLDAELLPRGSRAALVYLT